MRNYNLYVIWTAFLIIILLTKTHITYAEEENIYEKRFQLYKKTEAISYVPWYYLAAIDQYERNQQDTSEDEESLISIQYPDELWFGSGNIDHQQNINMIDLFQGIGKDGNGDGNANPENEEDILYTTAL